jgi:hypothetical protein
MASVKNLKKDLNNIIGEIIQNINLWQLENSDVDLKKSEKLIDECFDAFDSIIKKFIKKVLLIIINILKKSVLNLRI